MLLLNVVVVRLETEATSSNLQSFLMLRYKQLVQVNTLLHCWFIPPIHYGI